MKRAPASVRWRHPRCDAKDEKGKGEREKKREEAPTYLQPAGPCAFELSPVLLESAGEKTLRSATVMMDFYFRISR